MKDKEQTLIEEAEKEAKAYLKTLPAINYRSAYDFGVQNMAAFKAGFAAAAEYHKPEWIPVSIKPKFGGEYNVTVDLEDGEHPVTTTYDYDVKEDAWTDPITNTVKYTVLFYQEIPEPNPCTFIPKTHKLEPIINTLSYLERIVYGKCRHGENLASCDICNVHPKISDGHWQGKPISY